MAGIRDGVSEGDHTLTVALGKHLRYEHNMSRATVAKNLGRSPKWVKTYVEEE